LHDFVGPGFGELLGDVDAFLGHGVHRGAVDLVAGFGSTGPGDGSVARVVVEEPQGHLGPAGVVHAQEEHDRLTVDAQALDFGHRLQALPGEPLGQEWQEVDHGRLSGELVVRSRQKPLDGLLVVRPGELLGQPDGGGLEPDLLIQRDVHEGCAAHR
jgi:hypothetical protein